MTRATVPAPAGPPNAPYRLCFVCTGNICRSPMAAAVMTRLADNDLALAGRIAVSSAGTGPWHEGEPIDPRAQAALSSRGYDGTGHVAHQVSVTDLPHVDLLVALDRRHQQTLRSLGAGARLDGRLVLLRSFDRTAGGAVDVPDPYYGDESDFAHCLDQVELACRGLAGALAQVLGPVGNGAGHGSGVGEGSAPR
ncbi:MAG TPA: low molecular weight protein-tyrosine-phosphatase [Acidimicrobiales bacterium]|nr:low molecular weight protein-tyrosine-phosphatase [Acidimicrobiales bacterium]